MRKTMLCLAAFVLMFIASGSGFSLPTCYDCIAQSCRSSLAYDYANCDAISGGCIAWGACSYS